MSFHGNLWGSKASLCPLALSASHPEGFPTFPYPPMAAYSCLGRQGSLLLPLSSTFLHPKSPADQWFPSDLSKSNSMCDNATWYVNLLTGMDLIIHDIQSVCRGWQIEQLRWWVISWDPAKSSLVPARNPVSLGKQVGHQQIRGWYLVFLVTH